MANWTITRKATPADLKMFAWSEKVQEFIGRWEDTHLGGAISFAPAWVQTILTIVFFPIAVPAIIVFGIALNIDHSYRLDDDGNILENEPRD